LSHYNGWLYCWLYFGLDNDDDDDNNNYDDDDKSIKLNLLIIV